MKIKICGMRDPENIRAVAALKPDYMGFIFYVRSPRHCSGLDAEEVKGLQAGIEPVMVGVDMTESEIMEIVSRYGFRTVQLHGHESPELCRHLRGRGLTVIKAFGIADAGSFDRLKEYEKDVDLFLLDTKSDSKGGSGKKFDWTLLDAYDLERDFLLSGGIGPDDADEVLELRNPRLRGLDLNSRFETSPGLKDAERLRQFILRIKKI